MLWPKIVYPSDGLILAASNSVGTNALIYEEVAIFLADELLIRYAAALATRYNIRVENTDGVAVIESIAKSRYFLLKGGKLDLGRASRTLLQDYRTGLLGRVSLETPKTCSTLAD
jgi:ribosome biogenesis GTPase A